jgi:hypothetical protein
LKYFYVGTGTLYQNEDVEHGNPLRLSEDDVNFNGMYVVPEEYQIILRYKKEVVISHLLTEDTGDILSLTEPVTISKDDIVDYQPIANTERKRYLQIIHTLTKALVKDKEDNYIGKYMSGKNISATQVEAELVRQGLPFTESRKIITKALKTPLIKK